MATTTARAQLVKPAGTDNVVVATAINGNMDSIDSHLGAEICTSGTRPGSPFLGKIIYETNTRDVLMWTAQPNTAWRVIAHLGAYHSWTPAWTATGTAVALGNGTITGKFTLIGRTIDFQLTLTIGSTTTFGTGAYILSLPKNVVSSGFGRFVYNAFAVDDSSGAVHVGAGITPAGDNTITRCNFGSPGAIWGPTQPFTWATGDTMNVNGSYEAAGDN